MSDCPQIAEEAIWAWVGQQSFQRGSEYFQDGAITETRREGMVLRAHCEGSSKQGYELQVEFDKIGIIGAECSCPVGDGGHCKHIAALLITWRAFPERFEPKTKLEIALENCSRNDLIALLNQMIHLRPEFRELLDAVPSEGTKRAPVDPAIYQKKADAIFRRAYRQRGDEEIIPKLQILKATADGFHRQLDYNSASSIYIALVEAISANLEVFGDETWEPRGILDDCIVGLGRCLGQEQDASHRQVILRALFDIYHFDLDLGGIEISGTAPNLLVEQSTADERQIVAGWVRGVIETPEAQNRSYLREAFGALLLDLEADMLDDEAYLKVCRETGRINDLVDRLLSLGSVDEAVDIVRLASDYSLIGLADTFVRHRLGETGERLMVERSAGTKDTRVLDWLKNRYGSRGDKQAVLEMASRIFQLRPTRKGYLEIRDLARGLGLWEVSRPGLIEVMRNNQDIALLIDVYLDEDDIDLALETLETHSHLAAGNEIALKVALVAEQHRPQAAVHIYKRQIDGLIAQKQRKSYRQACALLVKLRALFYEMGERHHWRDYISDLRWRYGNHRALIQEMVAARV